MAVQFAPTKVVLRSYPHGTHFGKKKGPQWIEARKLYRKIKKAYYRLFPSKNKTEIDNRIKAEIASRLNENRPSSVYQISGISAIQEFRVAEVGINWEWEAVKYRNRRDNYPGSPKPAARPASSQSHHRQGRQSPVYYSLAALARELSAPTGRSRWSLERVLGRIEASRISLIKNVSCHFAAQDRRHFLTVHSATLPLCAWRRPEFARIYETRSRRAPHRLHHRTLLRGPPIRSALRTTEDQARRHQVRVSQESGVSGQNQ